MLVMIADQRPPHAEDQVVSAPESSKLEPIWEVGRLVAAAYTRVSYI